MKDKRGPRRCPPGDVSEEMLAQAQAAWDRLAGQRQDSRMLAAIRAAGLADQADVTGVRLYDVMRAYRAGRQHLGHLVRLRRALAYVVAEIDKAAQDS